MIYFSRQNLVNTVIPECFKLVIPESFSRGSRKRAQYMKKLLLGIILAVISIPSIVHAASTITLQTTYPSPSGNYNSLEATNVGIGVAVDGKHPLIISETTTNGNSTAQIANSTNGVGLNLGNDPGVSGTDAIIQSWNTTNNVATDLIINSSGGNVGIGVAPTAPLSVVYPSTSLNNGYVANFTNNLPPNPPTNTNQGNGIEINSQIAYAEAILLNDPAGFPKIYSSNQMILGAASTLYFQSGQDVMFQPELGQPGSSYNLDLNNNGLAINNNGNGPAAGYGLIVNTGNVGIGVTTPGENLEVNGNIKESWINGGTQYIGWNFTGGGTYTAGLRFPSGERGLNLFDNMQDGNGYISFDVGTASPGNEAMRIINTGNVGIGSPNPDAVLNVYQTNNANIRLRSFAGNWYTDFINNATSNGDTIINNVGGGPTEHINFEFNGASPVVSMQSTGNVGINQLTPAYTLDVVGNINASGNVTAQSDGRLKQNIMPLTGALNMIDQLRGVSYEWNHLAATMGHKEGEKTIGVIAQELQKVYPELVTSGKYGDKEYLSVDYTKFTAVLLQSIKELKAQVNTMQDEINELKKKQ